MEVARFVELRQGGEFLTGKAEHFEEGGATADAGGVFLVHGHFDFLSGQLPDDGGEAACGEGGGTGLDDFAGDGATDADV